VIGVISGAAVWLGFVITTIIVNNAFQKRTLALTVIDAAIWLAVLVLQGVVIACSGNRSGAFCPLIFREVYSGDEFGENRASSSSRFWALSRRAFAQT